MKGKLSNVGKKIKPTLKNLNLDSFLEEYTSKLEQKLVAQSQQLKTITDNAASCLFMLDNQGKPTYMNPAAVKVTGYTLEEIKDKELHTVLHGNHPEGTPSPEEEAPVTSILQSLRPIKDRENVFIKKDGTLFTVSYSVTPLQERGNPQGAVLEFQDISKRKELERQKDEFIAVASHELKTPVTSMKIYTQVLKLQFEKKGDIKASESLAKIDSQINKLNALIADLLDVTRTQTGNLVFRPETFDVDTLIHEVVENIQLTSKKHKILIKGKVDVSITADRDRTGQVLINFLTNAIKYSPQSNKIIVHAKSKKPEIVIGVQDFGIGIAEDKQSVIFERFMRVSGPRMETFAGLGLGLYISTQIITRQGGRIWVKSEENKGSTFYFSLPFLNNNKKT